MAASEGGASQAVPRSVASTQKEEEARYSLQRELSASHLDYHPLQTQRNDTKPAYVSDDVDDEDSIEDADPSEKAFHGQNQSAGTESSAIGNDEHQSEDLERGTNLEKAQTSKSSRSTRDPNLVTWDGPNDPKNPKNWRLRRKWAATTIVSLFTFISPVSSSMVAPALGHIARDLNIPDPVTQAMTMSVFLLAYAIGPLFLGPLSEIHGRVIVLQIGNLFYMVFNLACGFAQNKSQMIVFRFLSGLGGSVPLAIGGGVLSDLFDAEHRGQAISIYSLAPLLGPAVGPIAGGFITENTSWRWVFYATTICDALFQVAGLWLLQETYPPILLARKKNSLIKETGNTDLHTEWDDPNRTIWKTLKIALIRPFKLLGTQIIIQVLTIYIAYVYGLMYLVLSTFPELWTGRYRQSISTGCLNYIALGIGFFIGSQICAPTQDRIYRALKRRNNNVGKAEFRVPLMVPGALLVPIGLFWYGWSAQAQLHWIMPDIGAVIFTAGTIISFQCIQTYLVDAYTRYAASAFAAVTVLRSLCAFGFPLWAPYMYDALEYGWGNTLLALLSIVLGLPAPILLWKFGERLRQKSTFAAG